MVFGGFWRFLVVRWDVKGNSTLHQRGNNHEIRPRQKFHSPSDDMGTYALNDAGNGECDFLRIHTVSTCSEPLASSTTGHCLIYFLDKVSDILDTLFLCLDTRCRTVGTLDNRDILDIILDKIHGGGGGFSRDVEIVFRETALFERG